ncbi:unnamed protein product [Urochloa decumbens]|uniref:F-box domain-containing protein n=1 Tax=Urochloa decumbens TaxID=240449 RepID=A0ABC9BU30_9POAL
MDGGDGCWDFPADAFADILLRIPATSRQRLRLVCRDWRAVIDARAPSARPTEPKPLAYVIHNMGWDCATASAYVYVIDDLASSGGRCREVWRGGPDTTGFSYDTRLVGTCNGLLCLCDNTRPGGAISLVNPATGESLALPPLPGSFDRWPQRGKRWHQMYGLVHRPDTGRYAVLHLPCNSDPTGQRVMAFDAERERVAPAAPLPLAVAGNSSCHLTEVRGRLGFVLTVDEPKLARVEVRRLTDELFTCTCIFISGVHGGLRFPLFCLSSNVLGGGVQVWVLGGGKDGQRAWSCRYRVQVHGAPKASRQQLARPHFGFARGEFVLTSGRKDRENVVFAHRLAGAGKLQCGEVRVNERKPGTAVARIMDAHHVWTFAYVETTEPLSVYSMPR